MEKVTEFFKNLWEKTKLKCQTLWHGKEELGGDDSSTMSGWTTTSFFIESEPEEKRKLVLDEKTGKHEWTDGKEPFPLNDVEKQPYTYNRVNDSSLFNHPAIFEPIFYSRFTVDLMDIPRNYFQSYESHGEKDSCVRILLAHPDSNEFDIINKLKEIQKIANIKPARKNAVKTTKKVKKYTASLNVLDAIGAPSHIIKFNNVKIQQVEMFNTFTYESDKIQYATIYFSHDARVIE